MNYDELGFKCGIEIHQQLDTDRKLFCHCPVELEDEAPDGEFSRQLSLVAGESGEKDRAAELEASRSREFRYRFFDRCNCLVEADEEPPHSPSEEAVEAALQFADYVDAEIPEEVQVMRKIVLDGSNTSGFQRTMMIGLDGEIETEKGSVGIEDIELEEESAGIHSRGEGEAVYDLNRLGVPLIEVGTDALIQDPVHARQVAEKIGMLLRSTRKARRGLGTIRQDVNVSIEDGARVEIKGFQNVNNIDTLIRNEVERQKNLAEIEASGRVEADNVTYIFEDTDNELLSTILENNGRVYGLKIPGLAGKMKEDISADRYLAQELVDYARAHGIQGLIHTDEDIQGYGLVDEFEELEDVFDAEEGDVLAVLAGDREKAKAAGKAVRDRAKQVINGEVPEETRKAEQDFTTSYMRPLPGAARMYPETDIRPFKPESNVETPLTLEEEEQRLSKRIGQELASQLVYSERFPLFEAYKKGEKEKEVANFLVNVLPELEGEGLEPRESEIEKVLDEFVEDGLRKNELGEALENVVTGVERPFEQVRDSRVSEEEIREAVREVVEENAEMVDERGLGAQGALMGDILARVDADGSKVSRILREEIESR